MKTIDAKLVILGYQDVGKTTLINRYLGNHHHISPTIGASYSTCNLSVADNVKIRLKVWDTAGQERFRSMAPMYYRNANAALIVFDITASNTFHTAKLWVTELQRNVEGAMVLVVVGNKCDLANLRQVTSDEAHKYSESIGASYFETSALHDEGIEKVFYAIGRKFLGLQNGEYYSPNLRIQDSPSSGISSLDSDLALLPSSEESLTISSIAHGTTEKPSCC